MENYLLLSICGIYYQSAIQQNIFKPNKKLEISILEEVERQIEEEREKQKVLDAQIREAERKIQKEREKESDRGSKQRQSGGSRESADRGGSQKQRNEDKRKIRKLEDQLQLVFQPLLK